MPIITFSNYMYYFLNKVCFLKSVLIFDTSAKQESFDYILFASQKMLNVVGAPDRLHMHNLITAEGITGLICRQISEAGHETQWGSLI